MYGIYSCMSCIVNRLIDYTGNLIVIISKSCQASRTHGTLRLIIIIGCASIVTFLC